MFCLPSGGPGPQIGVDVEGFPAGRVELKVTVSTQGGQSEDFTVFLTVTGEETDWLVQPVISHSSKSCSLDSQLTCTDSVGTVVISLSCQGDPSPVANSSCSIDGEPQFTCTCPSIDNVLVITVCCCCSGDANLIEINPFEFSSGNHTLTIAFTDMDGNMGSTEYNFIGRTRDGK